MCVPNLLKLSKPTNMTIHWKALEEHFLMVPQVFSIQPFSGEILIFCIFLKKPWSTISKMSKVSTISPQSKISIVPHSSSHMANRAGNPMMFTACLPEHSQNLTTRNRSSGLIRNSYLLNKQMIINNS
jgi:hypothetical protein